MPVGKPMTEVRALELEGMPEGRVQLMPRQRKPELESVPEEHPEA